MSGPIIVAVDGSRRDADALGLAGRLRGVLDAAIVVAHAHPYGRFEAMLAEDENEELLRTVTDRVWEQVAEAGDAGDVTMRMLADTSPARALHELARAEEAVLLVAGASERGRVGLVAPGSTSERIVQGSPCPVAVAPAGYARSAPETFARAGCAYDGTPPARAALARAAGLARATGASLRVISVHEPVSKANLSHRHHSLADSAGRAEAEKELAAAIARLGDLTTDGVLLEGDPEARLSEQSDDLDILYVGSRGYGPVRSLLLGGVSGRLIRTATCPVVVCGPDA